MKCPSLVGVTEAVAIVKWLIKIRLDPEDGRIPNLSLAEVWRIINDDAKAVKMRICG